MAKDGKNAEVESLIRMKICGNSTYITWAVTETKTIAINDNNKIMFNRLFPLLNAFMKEATKIPMGNIYAPIPRSPNKNPRKKLPIIPPPLR